MKRHRIILFVILVSTLCNSPQGSVPNPVIRDVNLPVFYQSLYLQPIPSRIFTSFSYGMLPDRYVDVSLNPSLLLDYEGKSFYLELHKEGDVERELDLRNAFELPSYVDSRFAPPWTGYTTLNTLDINPFLSAGFYSRLARRIALAFKFRPVFDYGPYRSTTYWQNYYFANRYSDYSSELNTPDRLSVDKNQQKAYGAHSTVDVAYGVNRKFRIAFHAGYRFLIRKGNLYESNYGNYPHNSYADLEKEKMSIQGNQFEYGAGFIYGERDKIRLGAFLNNITGSAKENDNSLDTLQYWREDGIQPEYYTFQHNLNLYDEKYENSARTTQTVLILESPFSKNWRFRSFLDYRIHKRDISGWYSSEDTSQREQTYNYHDYSEDETFFRKEIFHSSADYWTQGSGTYRKEVLIWSNSLFLNRQNNWVFFLGFRLSLTNSEYKISESDSSFYHYYYEYFFYNPGTLREWNYSQRLYQYNLKTEDIFLFLPFGIRINISDEFNILFGTDLSLSFHKQSSAGDRNYPTIIQKHWEDEQLLQEDIQEDRREVFQDNPADRFNRTVGARFGMTYKHSSGVNFYILSSGDIFQTVNWEMGFELMW